MFIFHIMWVSNELELRVLTAITCTGLLKGILKNRLETVESNDLYRQGNIGEVHPGLVWTWLSFFTLFVCWAFLNFVYMVCFFNVFFLSYLRWFRLPELGFFISYFFMFRFARNFFFPLKKILKCKYKRCNIMTCN